MIIWSISPCNDNDFCPVHLEAILHVQLPCELTLCPHCRILSQSSQEMTWVWGSQQLWLPSMYQVLYSSSCTLYLGQGIVGWMVLLKIGSTIYLRLSFALSVREGLSPPFCPFDSLLPSLPLVPLVGEDEEWESSVLIQDTTWPRLLG